MKHATPTILLLASLAFALAACGARDPRTATTANGPGPEASRPAGLIVNGGFEAADHEPWTKIVHATPDAYTFELDRSGAFAGNAAMRITGDGTEPWGGIVQMVSRGNSDAIRLRLSAMARGRAMPGGIHLMATFRDGPMTDPVEMDHLGFGADFDWQRVEMDFDVPAGVSRVEVGLLLQGAGTLWLDEVDLRPAP
ncbi:MAG: hypothetical protein KF823_01845 [Xanthomonadales bacterium]|nr:hypothetical protein [Xanthomonadales bacterium]